MSPRAATATASRTASAGRSAAARALPVSAPATRPRLRLVPVARSKAARTPFVAVVVATLGLGLLGLLGLHTVLAEGSFRLHALEAQAADLATREQVLHNEVEQLRAPGSLASRARELGMVDGGSPAYLRLSDGAVLGSPTPGQLPVRPVPQEASAVVRIPAAPAASTTWTGPRTSPAPRASGTPR